MVFVVQMFRILNFSDPRLHQTNGFFTYTSKLCITASLKLNANSKSTVGSCWKCHLVFSQRNTGVPPPTFARQECLLCINHRSVAGGQWKGADGERSWTLICARFSCFSWQKPILTHATTNKSNTQPETHYSLHESVNYHHSWTASG